MNGKWLMDKHPGVFEECKYFYWYQELIGAAMSRVAVVGEIYEYHHFIPKSIIPNNNTVPLTPREHYIAHLLLFKCVVQAYKQKMSYAVTAMKMKTLKSIKMNSRLYERLKHVANDNRSRSRIGIPRSQDTKDKIRESSKNRPPISNATREKMSKARLGTKQSQDTIDKRRQAHIGKKRSDITRARLREDRARREKIVCAKCGGLYFPGNYHRWHGDNCKAVLSGGS